MIAANMATTLVIAQMDGLERSRAVVARHRQQLLLLLLVTSERSTLVVKAAMDGCSW